MKPTPLDWPRCTSSLFYRDAATAIEWLCDAFGFEVRIKVEGAHGSVMHSELTFGDGLIMVSQESPQSPQGWKTLLRSPQSVGATTQSIMVYTDDVDAHCERSRARGARIIEEPATHDFGAEYWSDRMYAALDPEGHLWWWTQRLRNPPHA